MLGFELIRKKEEEDQGKRKYDLLLIGFFLRIVNCDSQSCM
jgi:hypothetical protein